MKLYIISASTIFSILPAANARYLKGTPAVCGGVTCQPQHVCYYGTCIPKGHCGNSNNKNKYKDSCTFEVLIEESQECLLMAVDCEPGYKCTIDGCEQLPTTTRAPA